MRTEFNNPGAPVRMTHWLGTANAMPRALAFDLMFLL